MRVVVRILRAPFVALLMVWRALRWAAAGVAMLLIAIVVGNIAFHSPRGLPSRALDPASAVCKADAPGWDILANPPAGPDGPGVANDELWTIQQGGAIWQQRLACSIQTHALPGYRMPDGTTKALSYDLAFIEFQDDGKPYALRGLCADQAPGCTDEGFGPVAWEHRGQLDAVLDRLKVGGPHYVMVFIHGWRHDAEIGDSNVAEFRHYAAHAARFLEDRAAADPSFVKPHVTAIFIGWRGARTDENGLRHRFGVAGEIIGDVLSVLTLFDRKPVSEAVAPSVLSGLRAIEDALGILQPLAGPTALPAPQANKMIVFGHSLGGNMLATALQSDLIKKVERHEPRSYMLPVLGDLVVLINPAAEATKWTGVQRAVWDRMAVSRGERAPVEDYIASHYFFRNEQRPIVVSVTAALDWPPGGLRQMDCRNAPTDGRAVFQGVQYDWATYDMFPAFKGDLRPLADTLQRLGSKRDPHDPCATAKPLSRRLWGAPLIALGGLLRVAPFMQADPEQTHTIGNFDPPRGPATSTTYTGRPIGTTHELRGWSRDDMPVDRAWSSPLKGEAAREIPVDYDAIVGRNASCPVASGWLDAARRARLLADPCAHAVRWSSRDAGAARPALEFRHGFSTASRLAPNGAPGPQGGLPAITRANDPFWNMRAFDTALARHDGYMLSSFICAMNQLVMDDVTTFQPTVIAPPACPAAEPKP